MITSKICVDASLVIALLTPERFSPASLALWGTWIRNDIQVLAPMLLRYEVTSALYRKAFQKSMSSPDIEMALKQFLAMDIQSLDPDGLPERAIKLATQYTRPNTYDAFYLALAEQEQCVLWTGDERLYNAVRIGYSNIEWLGNHLEAKV
jgi:predicted nucleic acid-binding protein